MTDTQTYTYKISIDDKSYLASSFSFSLAYDTDHKFEIDLVLNPDEEFISEDLLGKITRFEIRSGSRKFIYNGLVTDIQDFANLDGAHAKIKGSSPLWKLSMLQINRSFCKLSPHTIAQILLSDFEGIELVNNLTTQVTGYWVTFRESYNNALRRLCEEKCGEFFIYDGEKVHLGLGDKKYDDIAEETLELGSGLKEVSRNVAVMPLDVRLYGWNKDTQKPVKGNNNSLENNSNLVLNKIIEAAKHVFPKPEKWFFAKSIGSDTSAMKKATIASQGRLARAFSISGRSNNPNLKPGTIIKIKTYAIGKSMASSLNGLFRVLTVEYYGDNSGHLANTFWAIPVENTVPPKSIARYRPSCLSMIGIVKEVKNNLAKVILPWDDPNADLPFRRVLQSQTQSNIQTHYLPSPGTQVLCLFEDASPSHPIVLGAFYTGREQDASEWNGKHGFHIGDVKFVVDEKSGALKINAKQIIFDADRYDFK